MTKTTAGLLGAVAVIGTMSAARAMPSATVNFAEVFQGSSYADRLKPIPNAVEPLKAHEAMAVPEQPGETAEIVQPVQYYYGYGGPYHAPYRPPPYAFYPRYGGYRGPYFHRHRYYHPYYHHYGFYRRY